MMEWIGWRQWGRAVAITVTIMWAAALGGCGDNAAPAALQPGEKLRVAATTTMIADLARQIGGEDVEVISIMRPGEDPHIYEVRPRDKQLMGNAHLVLVNGHHLEAQLEKVALQSIDPDRLVRLAQSPGIETLGGQDGAAVDPHCWFNVAYFMIYAERARDAMIKADPARADRYRQRAEAYLTELRALHEWIKAEVAAVPRQRRVMVTSHDAFAYFGQAYDVEVHGVIGISTEQQVRPRDKRMLEEVVRERGVKALFIETSVSESLNNIVRQIAEETGATVGGTLYSDSLGPDDSPANTYIGMLRHNTTTIVEALK